jgi:[protein-PII] uridylyltransferase
MNTPRLQLLDTLKNKRLQLEAQLLKKNTPVFLKNQATALDDYFRNSLEISQVGQALSEKNTPCAIIALGGYGRQEQCLHSDVDLLFLFEKSVPDEAEALVREIVYPLWNIGLEVGHATRSIRECVAMAKKDIEVLTPFLNSRFLCGMSPWYLTLMEQLRTKVLSRQPGKIITQLIKGTMARYQYFGASTYLLEPNIKEGRGGLRDYHTMLWIARIKYDLKHPRDLEYFGLLSHKEYQQLTQALRFIWQVRNRLHQLTNRKCDQLYFDYQQSMPQTLNITDRYGQTAVERFLGRLHSHMDLINQLFFTFLLEQGYKKMLYPNSRAVKKSSIKGLAVDKEMLTFSSSEAILKNPSLLLQIFEESARLKMPLSAEGKRLLHEFLYLMNSDFASSKDNLTSFERILSMVTHEFNVLDDMLSTGFLSNWIPEFKQISHRIQYDEYHLFPVDRHSLRTVQAVKELGTSDGPNTDPLYKEFYQGLKNRKLLLWAALLHDIGKGQTTSDHSAKGAEIVKIILEKKGYATSQIDLVTFLVQEHLLLVKIATRRDLNDEATAIACATKVKNVLRLKMLYILTLADSYATGPKAWNDWARTLVRDLALKVYRILETGELVSSKVIESTEEKKKTLLTLANSQDDIEQIDRLLQDMSPRYLLYSDPQEIYKHSRLYQQLNDNNFVWQVEKSDMPSHRVVTICAKDHPGLFSKIAGALTLGGFDILDAKVFTWRNNIALDIFEVKAPVDYEFEAERLEKTHGYLESALAGQLDIADALQRKMAAYRSNKMQPKTRPYQVVIDNESSSFFTIIEVHAYDFPGLLFSVTDTLFRCKVDVWVAKIATKADQVVDVFYTRGLEGQKIDNQEKEDFLKQSILCEIQ